MSCILWRHWLALIIEENFLWWSCLQRILGQSIFRHDGVVSFLSFNRVMHVVRKWTSGASWYGLSHVLLKNGLLVFLRFSKTFGIIPARPSSHYLLLLFVELLDWPIPTVEGRNCVIGCVLSNLLILLLVFSHDFTYRRQARLGWIWKRS